MKQDILFKATQYLIDLMMHSGPTHREGELILTIFQALSLKLEEENGKMPMTKRDFEALAKLLDGMRTPAMTTREQGLIDVVATKIADHCKRTNMEFNTARFLNAAGVKS